MAEVKRQDELQGAIVHEYDGIEEADNNLPLWWLAIFYGAIVFAIGYYFYYDSFAAAPIGRAAYDQEMAAQAAAAPEVTEEQLVAMGEDTDAVAAGRTVFETNCVACHDDQAQGKIGPNLTDAYWIHGGAPMDIHNTIQNGYAAKGMPPWGASLGAEAVNQAVAYVLSIRDTNVEGKEQQGELYAPDGQAVPENDAPALDAGAAADGAAAEGAAADAATTGDDGEGEAIENGYDGEPSVAPDDSEQEGADAPPAE